MILADIHSIGRAAKLNSIELVTYNVVSSSAPIKKKLSPNFPHFLQVTGQPVNILKFYD